jgi:hypothetical protein
MSRKIHSQQASSLAMGMRTERDEWMGGVRGGLGTIIMVYL